MFEYLDPDASGASNLPPAQPAKSHPRPEKVRHMLYGSRAAIDRTIKILHAYGYADPNDWSDPLPTDQPNQWMVILTKILLIE
ncbi:hypothetical protein [Phormidium tenue]|uniref:Uncharacterized protein n=1 Tax=Phormidium tenue NIES-30 TaxID=549789 RepID=A0A1U7J1G4_9CYAN|nr:hypothetical protein [Phormidium tenue]MBD2232232.1 hypothetical protein [Phormidium tenue FACHB-1052]OKH45829.1 hypothetical protein NIES30_18270 [Phormidium tenue NIES-30]